MPIISSIGRKHPRTRLLILSIYVVLILGSVTMLYPFLLMLSGSTKSSADVKHLDIIPPFITNDAELYKKHIEGLFNESLDAMNMAYDDDIRSFEALEPPRPFSSALVNLWSDFISAYDIPSYAYAGGYMRAGVTRTVPQGLREFKAYVSDMVSEDIDEVNNALEKGFVGWNSFFVIPESYLSRRRMPADEQFLDVLWSYKASQPTGYRYYFSPEGFFKKLFLKSQYSRDVSEYNSAHETSYRSYDEIVLSRRMPMENAAERKDWEMFVRETLNPIWIRVAEAATQSYHHFLQAKHGSIDSLNDLYRTDYTSFLEVPLVEVPPFDGAVLSDWNAFLAGWRDPDTDILHQAPLDSLRIESLEFQFQDHLQERFGSLDQINQNLGTDYASLAEIAIPQREAHYAAFMGMRDALRSEFITRNYRMVLDFMVFHGRGILNTVIYCVLAVVFALLVNPMAAYAMSRYRMPSSYRILFFLMLTMAFPPMVTQIPSFLMLREMNLLNTFAALILPGLAYGYSIFLLKGFFDSLPRDLYDSASIDGANEWRMFWTITMSLSKPILAVIALQAFTMAYSNFMFALLICQDESMWTLMVWLYQLQKMGGSSVMYASLIIAAIPTLIIFIFCQNIIIRGIVIPVEK